MKEEKLQELIARWEAGDATPDERRELERLLDEDADARQKLARYFMEEAKLYGVFRKAAGYKHGAESQTAEPAPVITGNFGSRRTWSSGPALVAAFLIMAMGGVLFLVLSPASQEITVNGRAVSTLPADARIEVGPDAPATLQLSDGSELTFEVPDRPDSMSKNFFRLLDIARAQVPGGIPVEAEFDGDKDSRYFTVEIVQGRNKIELRLDPQTGEVLDRGKPDSVDSKDQFEEIRTEDLARAVRNALEAYRGIAWSAEVEREKARHEAKVKIATTVGERVTVRVDVKTGAILGSEKHDLEDDD